MIRFTKNKEGFGIVGIIIIIAAVAILGGGYWYWQTSIKIPPEISPEIKDKIDASTLAPSEIEGWKTYRNEQYGFEVRYPSTHEVQFLPGYKLGEFSVCEDEHCAKFLAIYQGPLEELTGPYQNYHRINEPDHLRGLSYYYSINKGNKVIDQILSTFKFIK